MTISEAASRLRLFWRLWPLAIILPLLLSALAGWIGVISMPISLSVYFTLAVTTVFVTLPCFRGYKNALLQLYRQREQQQPNCLPMLLDAQKHGLLAALAPAWLGVIGWICGMESVAVLLLTFASLLLWLLYRTPAQLR